MPTRSKAPPKKNAPPKTRLVAIALVVFAIVGGAAALAHWGFGTSPHGPHDAPVTVSSDNTESLAWDAAADPPFVAVVGEREDFGGAFWKAEKGESRRDHTLFLGFFDGATHERLWYVGPFGRGPEARRWMHFGFVRGRVLVTDWRGTFYAFDAATGRQQLAIKLPNQALRLCMAPSDAADDVWVEAADPNPSVVVDFVRGTTTPTPMPATCRPPALPTGCANYRSHVGCGSPQDAPSVPGFQADRVLGDGEDGDGIAFGTSTGSGDATKPISTIVGFDQATKAVRFQINTASDAVTNAQGASSSSVAEIAAGRLYAQYALKDTRWRLAAFDAKTGQRLWDVVVPGTKHGDEARSIVLSSSRLYLSHGDWLDVFDLKTGGARGEFGR